jgi:hypothetical protein
MGNDTPQILQGLPDAATPATGNDYSGAQSGPVTPGTNLPLPPNMAANNQAAQPSEEAPTYQPGSLADKIASAYLQHLTKNQPPPVNPQPQQQPSTAQRIGSALNAASAGLGDARTGSDPRGGWLGAVAATLNARSQRKAQESATNFDQQERLKNDQINLATANANLRQHVLTAHKLDKESRDEDAAAGELFMSHLRSGSELSKGQPDSFQVQDHITNDQLKEMATKDPKFLQTHTARVTGYEPVLNADGTPKKDADGFAIESPLYSVANIAAGDTSKSLTVTPELAKKWNDAGLQQVTAGTILPVTVANKMDIQAQRYGTTLSILNHDKVTPLPNEVKDQMVTVLNDPDVQHAIAMNPGSPLAGLYEASDNMKQHIQLAQQQLAAAQKSGNPQAIAAAQQDIQSHQAIAQNLDKTINTGFTDAERSAYQKGVEADRKQTEVEQQNAARDTETARHNRAEEGLKATDLAQKKQQGVVSNLTGDDYLQTLPTAQQGIVRAVGEGRQKLPANRKEALALLEQVHQAYPDFDESKVGTWQKANNEYRGSGKTATQVVPAYNTALEHMQDLYSNTTSEGIFNPLSKAYQDREVALGYVAREVGKAVSAGVMTQKESEDLLGTLKGGLTPALKRERITKTAQLLHDKIDEYQTKFQESAPSSAVKVPTLISPKAAQSFDFVTGKAQPDAAPQAPQVGAIKTFPNGAKGVWDGKGWVKQ